MPEIFLNSLKVLHRTSIKPHLEKLKSVYPSIGNLQQY
ncbi:hypothetical protein EV14_0171 [Prochlorococcus sp. MIT 0703]|nr:hypothetical protein EV12_0279 [Prochlorococcus sp. MIT 0701]KGG36961.1 hypothetical protein EV14_0171 [Prochlorococcus sp. MIT 0703]